MMLSINFGDKQELVKEYKDSELSGREYKRVVEYVESLLRDEKLKKNWMLTIKFMTYQIYYIPKGEKNNSRGHTLFVNID